MVVWTIKVRFTKDIFYRNQLIFKGDKEYPVDTTAFIWFADTEQDFQIEVFNTKKNKSFFKKAIFQ